MPRKASRAHPVARSHNKDHTQFSHSVSPPFSNPTLSYSVLSLSLHSIYIPNRGRFMEEFGSWDYGNEVPVIRDSCFREVDLFKVPVAMPVTSAHLYGGHCRRKGRKGKEVGVERQEQKRRKQGRLCSAADDTQRRRRAPKAVDEDLYKIPPELIYRKPNRKRMLRNLLSGCLGLNCIC